MKKKETGRLAAAMGTATGSPSASGTGIDMSALYIDMLCEKFKDRGVRTSARIDAEEQDRKSKQYRKALGLRMGKESVCATDKKYRNMNVNGRPCMSSDDFAAYYKDLRDYKMPRFYSRAETEYEAAEAEALAEKNVQESGKSPKKAVWLAIARRAKDKIREIPSHLNVKELREFAERWFLVDKYSEVREGKTKRMPAGVISTFLIITLSLLLVVCSSVMVSRASAEVSSLEDRIERLDVQKKDLEGKLEVKNDMIGIKDIAVNQYGMISSDYASSKYIDLKEDEKIEKTEGKSDGESWLDQILRAIGLKKD